MITLLGSIGWGLLTIGAVTHVWHQGRLRSLLAMHLDNETLPAGVLTATEVALAVALPVTLLTNHWLLPWFAAGAFLLGLGFIVWIARLLLTGSTLPCACSFSDAPTSWWSFGRALCVGLVALLAFAPATDDAAAAMTIATMAVGVAVAAGIFVVPEAISWPSASKALMARVDAHSLESHSTSDAGLT